MKTTLILLISLFSYSSIQGKSNPSNSIEPLIFNEKKENPLFFQLYSKLYKTIKANKSPSKKEFQQLMKLTNRREKPHIELLHYLHALHQLSSISKQEKHHLYRQLKPLLLKFPSEKQKIILQYTAKQLSSLYFKSTIESNFSNFFANNKEIRREDIFRLINFTKADRFKSYIEKKKRSFFDEIIFNNYMKILHKKDIAKILATLYMQDNKFLEAQFYIRQAPRENLYSPFNPFNATLVGDNKIISKKDYSQREFAETILRIEDTLKKHPSSARDHFLYATALYNKSWFGNFPLSSVFYRDEILTKNIPKTTNLHQAENEYLLAFYYAKNNNFKAKISYQLLKIAFNNLLIKDFKKSKKKRIMLPVFGTKKHFTPKIIKKLKRNREFKEAIYDFKAEYSHTKFGKKAIETNSLFQQL